MKGLMEASYGDLAMWRGWKRYKSLIVNRLAFIRTKVSENVIHSLDICMSFLLSSLMDSVMEEMGVSFSKKGSK